MAISTRRKEPSMKPPCCRARTRSGCFCRSCCARSETSICSVGRQRRQGAPCLKQRTRLRRSAIPASIVLASAYLASAYAQLGDIPRGLEIARACQAGAKQKGYEPIEASPFSPKPASYLFRAPSAMAEAIARFERTIEMATRLGTRPLLGLAKGALARLLAGYGQKGGGTGRTHPGDRTFCQVENDYSIGTC